MARSDREPAALLLQTLSEADSALRSAKYATDFAQLPRPLQTRAVQILRMHVMDNVRQRIEAGHLDFVNEIRVCTVLFLGFPSLKVGKSCINSCCMACLVQCKLY